jgi:copper chaperone
MKRTLNVKGMSCNHCRTSVTEALRRLPGVARVEVDLGGNVDVVFDERRVAEPALCQAIEDAGFEVVQAGPPG